MAHEELPPLNITPGAIRFNTDSMKLEYFRIGMEGGSTSSYAGIGTMAAGEWVQITTTSPDIQTGGTRGVFAVGADNTAYVTTTQYINISATGNAVDFGDLTGTARGYGASFSSSIRGIFAGGQGGGSPQNKNVLDFVTIATTGTATAFGSISDVLVRYPTGLSNETRGILIGGYDGSANSENMRYVTIAATGNTVDFGDISGGASYGACGASSTRGVIQRGNDEIDHITIHTLGNAADFGSCIARSGCFGLSNSVRAVIAGGAGVPSGTAVNTTEYVTIATLGNASDFGDLTLARRFGASAASPTRGTFIGGGSYPAGNAVIDYVTIPSTGNAVDFGDPIDSMEPLGAFGCSNGHGGLG